MREGPPPLVLHVIHHLVTGGMENGLVNLINQMSGSVYRHVVACIEDYSEFSERLTADGTEVIALHRSQVGIWKVRRDLFRLCRRLQPAIVHTRNQSGLDALMPARLAGVRHSVHGEHGWDVHDLHGEKTKPALLRRLHSPLIDRYITVSKDLERYLVRRVGIAPARITQIYNGVDTARFVPTGGERAAILPEGFAESDSIIVGTVGRIQRVKDQATLLRAFASVVNIDVPGASRARLVIVGDGPLFAELRELAASLGIANRTWFPGALNNVAEVLRTFDVFVLPSLNEGISNTILEAMASGVPVIATAVGGNVELLDDKISGRLFQPGNVDVLAQLLADYFLDPTRRREHGVAARQAAVARFSIDTMVSRYQEVYDGLLASRPR
jgi:sugar transferase (PEP-CTERM/EpsH1 system associated)